MVGYDTESPGNFVRGKVKDWKLLSDEEKKDWMLESKKPFPGEIIKTPQITSPNLASKTKNTRKKIT